MFRFKLTPLEALEWTIMRGLADSMRLGPGKIVAKSSDEIREALKQLESKDVAGLSSYQATFDPAAGTASQAPSQRRSGRWKNYSKPLAKKTSK